jgi:multiple sugar transport system permease protein
MTNDTISVAPTVAAGPARGRGWQRYRTSTFYLFTAPWIIGFLLLTLLPLLYALGVSFTNYDGASPVWRFIGLRNYVEFFTDDPKSWEALARTFGYTALVVPLSVVGGLYLALLVNRRIRARGIVRAIFFVPSVVPIVATAIMWKLIFNRDAGLVNGILGVFGVEPVAWLTDNAFYALIVVSLWGIGGGMIISLAALQDVPGELEEAARIDGAGTWRVIRNITIPMISPVLYFQVITGVIATLQVLVQPMLLAESNRLSTGSALIPQSNKMFMVEVYTEFFSNGRFGYGSAMLWVFFLFILILTLILQRLSRRAVFYQSGTDSSS